jgi:hypothetical protein
MPLRVSQVAGEGRHAALVPVPGRLGRRPQLPSAENRRYLRKGGSHYIIGERLRSGSPEADAALSQQGRYQDVADNLRVKEVRIAEDRNGRIPARQTPDSSISAPRSCGTQDSGSAATD